MPMPGNDPDYVQGANDPWYADYAAAQAAQVPQTGSGTTAPTVPGAPPTSAPTQTTSSGLPNYSDLLAMAQGSPFWQQLEDARRAQDAAELANVQQGARTNVVQWGEDLTPYLPSAWSQYNLLDAQTSALARQNTQAGLSSIARLRESRDLNIRDLIRALNARGMRRSGSRLFGMNRANLNYERTSGDQRNALLAGIANMLSSYGNNAYSRLMGNQSQMANLMNMFSSSYNPGAYSGVTYGGVNSKGYTGQQVADYLGLPSQQQTQAWLDYRAQNPNSGML